MFINELPDDCLLAILDYIQDLEDLINCFKDQWDYSPICFYSFVNPPIDVTCLSKLFPNLRIVDLSFLLHEKVPIEYIDKLITDSESLKGIIYDKYLDFDLKLENANLEMLSIGNVNPNISGIYENVKQLCLWSSNLYLDELAHFFPNLERLQFYKESELSEPGAPVFANLKILEMEMSHVYCEDDWCPFVFMDSCPALQSAHIRISCFPIEVNDSIKLANLQDLVIKFFEFTEWKGLRRIMLKYPNLKHLALRGIYLSKENIKELILILPKLTLLDIRESYGITQEASNHVSNYCKQHDRSIKFYFKKDDKQIISDWPQTLNRPDKICCGFDFMEHCFFKDFIDLPYFLDPIDD